MFAPLNQKSLFRPLRRRLTPPALLLFLLSVAVSPLHAQQQRRLRIAIMTFDVNAVIQQRAAKQFGINGDLGRDLSDLLLSKLVQDGKFVVVERTALDKVLHEQNVSNSDRNDPATAARIGKILGVDAIVIGSVTEFSAEQRDSKYGSVLRAARLNGATFEKKTSEVTVAISGHIVNTSTAEVLAAATGTGDAVKGQSDFRQSGSSDAIGSSTSTQDFGSPLANEAAAKAIGSMAVQLEMAPAMNMPVTVEAPPRASYSGVVADVSGKTLILTIGTGSGIKVGDVVEISRPGRIIKDPRTGKVLTVLTDPLGKATVTEANAQSSTVSYSGTATVKVDDHASSTP